MSDLSDLHGIFPDSLRWNAETGVLGIAGFNPETGEREVQEILLGNTATFVLDLATRERGYGLIKVGLYDMRLTPVGSPPPPWPGDEEYKPALGCWLWNPTFGELRLETNAAIFRQAIANVWDRARFDPGGHAWLATCDQVRRSRRGPGQVGRQDILRAGSANRRLGRAQQRAGLEGAHANRPSARGPAALGRRVDSSPATPSTPAAKKPAKVGKGAAKPAPDDPPPFDDPIPWK